MHIDPLRYLYNTLCEPEASCMTFTLIHKIPRGRLDYTYIHLYIERGRYQPQRYCASGSYLTLCVMCITILTGVTVQTPHPSLIFPALCP